MESYGASTYGDEIAEDYDELYGDILDTEPAVERLAALAGDEPILELGVGTGRLAIPLAERGFEIHGVDSSQKMVDRLRSKPGGEEIRVAVGSFADDLPQGPFSLVFVAFNTIFALLSQDEQVRCFANVAHRLAPGGRFVVEAFVPDMTRWTNHQATQTTRVEGDRVLLETSRHDPAQQRVDSHHVMISPRGIRLYPVRIRYAWPSELDLMARLAGLGLEGRRAGWKDEPFDSSSLRHVSVYRPED